MVSVQYMLCRSIICHINLMFLLSVDPLYHNCLYHSARASAWGCGSLLPHLPATAPGGWGTIHHPAQPPGGGRGTILLPSQPTDGGRRWGTILYAVTPRRWPTVCVFVRVRGDACTGASPGKSLCRVTSESLHWY